MQQGRSTPALAWESGVVPGFLVRDRWDNRKAVEEMEGPVLLIQGKTDEVIPYSQAETLARVRVDLDVTEIQCGHNDCAGEWTGIQEIVRQFLVDNGVVSRDRGSPGS